VVIPTLPDPGGADAGPPGEDPPDPGEVILAQAGQAEDGPVDAGDGAGFSVFS
jgi:hypothetical protein